MAKVVVTANGSPFTGWVEVTVDQAHDKVAGQAHVKMSELPGNPLPMRIGDFAQVLIDKRPVITGYVREVDGELVEHSHYINATIRDQTQDLVDSTIGPKLKLKPPITLQQMAQQTIGVMGLNIPVIDNIGPPPYEHGEQISASIDDRGFKFLDDWAQKRQVLFNTDGKGSLVIDRNRKLRAPAMLMSTFEDNPANNVKKSKYRNSDLDRHNSVAVNGQKSTNDKDWWQSKQKGEATAQANPLQKNWGLALDSAVRSQLKLHARGTKGLSGTSPSKAAKWRSNAAKARGFQYTATVQGFYGSPGWLWWHGYIVPVLDTHWEIEAELLISAVKFHKNVGGGETTEITCTYPDAFTADEAGSAAAMSRTSKFGLGGSGVGSYPGGDGNI